MICRFPPKENLPIVNPISEASFEDFDLHAGYHLLISITMDGFCFEEDIADCFKAPHL